MPADVEPVWLLAWRGEHDQQPPEPEQRNPRGAGRPRLTPPIPTGADLQGMIEPKRWDYDGCVRREQVLDADVRPPRVVRRMGWQRCLKCRRPFFSEDVLRLRLCTAGHGTTGCREHDDRFA